MQRTMHNGPASCCSHSRRTQRRPSRWIRYVWLFAVYVTHVNQGSTVHGLKLCPSAPDTRSSCRLWPLQPASRAQVPEKHKQQLKLPPSPLSHIPPQDMPSACARPCLCFYPPPPTCFCGHAPCFSQAILAAWSADLDGQQQQQAELQARRKEVEDQQQQLQALVHRVAQAASAGQAGRRR